MKTLRKSSTAVFSIAVSLIAMAPPAVTEVKLPGYFIARAACPAFQSFKKGTYPGDVKTETDRVYHLFSKNGEPDTHYKIRIGAQPNERWVEIDCGEHVAPFVGCDCVDT